MIRFKNHFFRNCPLVLLETIHLYYHQRALSEWEEREYLFIHVPKAAGTSVNASLNISDLGHITFQKLVEINPTFLQKRVVFCVFRSALSRLLSTFRYAKNAEEKKGYSSLSAIAKYESFDEFVKYYITRKRVRKHYFLRSYYSFLANAPTDRTYIINYNDLNSSMNIFSRDILDINIELERLNPSTHNKIEYSTTSLEKINDLYKDDYEIDNFFKINPRKRYALLEDII